MDIGNPNTSIQIIDETGKLNTLKRKDVDALYSMTLSNSMNVLVENSTGWYHLPPGVLDYLGGALFFTRGASGSWNMDANPSADIAHGIDMSKYVITNIGLFFRNDAGTMWYPYNACASGSTTPGAIIKSIDTDTINVERVAGGIFDNASFSSEAIFRWQMLITFTRIY